jgi:putative ABC transport system permease protein
MNYNETGDSVMIKLEGVSKFYKSALTVGVGIRRVSVLFDLNEFVVITGESGSGKSTLLNVISGLDDYEEGEMYIHGEETSHYTIPDWEAYRAENIGFIFQNYNIIDAYTVMQNVLLALELQNYPKEKRKQRANELIERVGLTHRKNHKAAKLSGGEKQRAVIARAIAKDCPVIVADEPTGNLDSTSSAAIFKLLHEISKDKLVVLVTHNFDDVKAYATRRIRMRDGEVVEDRVLKETKKTTQIYQNQDSKKLPLSTLINSSVRNVFSAPKRLIFLLSLQMAVIAAFVLVYAFLMASADIIIGEQAAENDSSHQLILIRRNEESIDPTSFYPFGLVRSVAIYETSYQAYQAFGRTSPIIKNRNYPLGEVNMEDANVLNLKDLTQGEFPTKNEVVLSDLMMELYDINVGDELIFFGRFLQFVSDYGKIFTVSGSTIRGNNKTVYFNNEVFNDKEIALDGLIIAAGANFKYDHIDDNGNRVKSSFGSGTIFFDPTLPEGTIHIPNHLLPDPMEVVILGYEMNFGPYYGQKVVFDVATSHVVRTPTQDSYYVFSTSFQETLLEAFFGEDFQLRKAILNVHDLTDGKRLSDQLDHETYRVYYDVSTPSSRQRIMTQGEFDYIAYLVVIAVGGALYTVLGVVMKNVNIARKKDFAIFRSIGANRSYLAKQVILEQVIVGLIAFVLALAFIFTTAYFYYPLSGAIRHVSVEQYVGLFFIAIALSIYLANLYNKKFFKFSVIAALSAEAEESL